MRKAKLGHWIIATEKKDTKSRKNEATSFVWFLGINQKTVRCLFLLGREIAENLSLLSPEMEERMKNDSGNEKLKFSEQSRIQKRKTEKYIFRKDYNKVLQQDSPKYHRSVFFHCFPHYAACLRPCLSVSLIWIILTIWLGNCQVQFSWDILLI